MLNSKIHEQRLLHHCGSIHDDDGIDPRIWFTSPRRCKRNYKALQICRQVADTLQYVLAAGNDDNNSGDSQLEALKVIAVTPAPDSRHLLITVTCADRPIDATVADEILATLKVHTPRLRAEIARSITRRKTPNLSFQYSQTAE